MKWFPSLLALVSLTAVALKPLPYYEQQPKALPQALQQCQANKASAADCDALQNLARQLDDLAYALQASPQHYGLRILELQNHLAAAGQQAEETLAAKRELQLRLAVVRWLETPEG